MILCFNCAVNKSEVECLIKLFDSLVAKSSSSNHHAVVGLDHDMFRDTLHSAFGLTDDMMMDRGEADGSENNVRFYLYIADPVSKAGRSSALSPL